MTSLRLAAAVVCALAAGTACRGRPARPASGSGGPPADPPAPVASVGSSWISKAELSDFVYERFREQWTEALDELVDERVVSVESAALGVVVPPAALDAAVEAEVVARREQLRARFGDATDLEASVRSWYGFDVATWRARVLRPRLAVHLALARVVRLSARVRDQVVARVIVVSDRAKAEGLRGKVDRGADFSLTALESSEDASRTVGGVIPPIARGDLPAPDLDAALFSSAVGATVGPIAVRAGDLVEWHLYRVVDRVAAWPGPPSTLGPLLEADLARSPVSRAEYERWAARVRRTYGVRTFAPDGAVLSGDRRGR